MRGVIPDREEKFKDKDGNSHTVYLWTTPLKKESSAEPGRSGT